MVSRRNEPRRPVPTGFAHFRANRPHLGASQPRERAPCIGSARAQARPAPRVARVKSGVGGAQPFGVAAALSLARMTIMLLGDKEEW